ncbi:MAG: hypothetical protein LRY43_00775 [Gammaproteobacteria bacterium]|nr:hypothetical protein [Gammaproteobacteria bacterium]
MMILGLQHWHYHIDHDNIAWATFSKKRYGDQYLRLRNIGRIKKKLLMRQKIPIQSR